MKELLALAMVHVLRIDGGHLVTGGGGMPVTISTTGKSGDTANGDNGEDK